jgi:serine/threonine-protein kinase
MALQVGERVGDYEVLALIGAGGMGQVYKVRNIFSNREEAMKVLLPDLTSERELAARFMMEIRTLASLDHPNIAQLRTAFQFQNQLVMIMEFVEGVTLEKLASEGAIPIDRELDYATQVLSALSFAHSHGIIHRDIKPANIMITTHGLVKLMDFGIAKNADEMHLTRPGMTIGSVYYMSPEQVRGGTVDARSDLYSFGITLYESLTGRKPFEADTSYSVLHAQCNEAPIPPITVNPALSPELNAIVLKALEKNPLDRYQTAQEFHDALKALREKPASRPVAAPVAVAAAAPAFAPSPTSAGAFSATSAGFAPVAAAAVPAEPAAAAGFAPVTPPAPAFAPVAAGGPVAVQSGSSGSKSHRGLWIGLGALAAVLALVAVAVVLPHVFATYAKQKLSSAMIDQQASSTSTPAATPQTTTPTPDATPQAVPNAAATPPADTAGASSASGTSGDVPATSPDTPQKEKGKAGSPITGSGEKHRPAYTGSTAQAGANGSASSGGAIGAVVPPGPVAPTGPSPQEIRETRNRLLNIEARADSARAGVESIRTQQQRQGLDIRGDILATMNRLTNDLRDAHTALEQRDLQTAADYMERADKATSRLETFLGR